MQNLDEFKVRNFTKRVLAVQLELQEKQIYEFIQRTTQTESFKPNDDAYDSEEEMKENTTESAEVDPHVRPSIAPIPGSDFSFEDKVESSLQSYVLAEHDTNLLMPTINAELPCLKEKQFKEYLKNDKLYKLLYEDSTMTQNDREESKSGGRKEALQPTSLMLVQGSYDNRVEKLDLRERKKRKVYAVQETGYELQDQYRINDSLLIQGRDQKAAFGRATYQEVMQQSKLRVHLCPQVYPQRDFEATMLRASGTTELGPVKDYLKVLINFFKSNPYAAAKLFHGIATGAFQFEPDSTKDDCQSFYSDTDEMQTRMEWGSFLPGRVRQMLLNMSRYFFDNLLASDSVDPSVASEKFSAAFKIFIQYSDSNELFSGEAPLQIHWHFLQVIKALFDGQTRCNQAQETLKKILKPVYERFGISAIRKQLTQVTESNSQFLRTSQQLNSETNIVDQLRGKLFDANPNYSFSTESLNRRQQSERISDLAQLLHPREQGDSTSNFHDATMPSEISRDMFKVLSRVLPAPVLAYEHNLLEPLTSVFGDFQNEYNQQDFNLDPNLKTLPDCNVFTFEVVNTNLLLVDVYAPKGRISHTASQREEVQQLRPDPGAAELKQLMTAKVIEICTNIIDSLRALKSEIPFRLRFMLKLILDKGKSDAQITESDAPMIADFLAGCWLSNAFRWPECLGMEPSFKEESLVLGHLLTACRLVFETTLSCSELPYPSNGHKTYNITELNAFITSQKQNVLALYNNLFETVDVNLIKVRSFNETRSENPTKPHAPREIFEASLMRTQDFATLIKLVQWQFQEHWTMYENFEIRLDLQDEGAVMIKLNSEDVLRSRIQNAKLDPKTEMMPKRKENLAFWDAKKGESGQLEKGEEAVELSPLEKTNTDWYIEIHEKQFAPFSMDLEWPFVNYNYNPNQQWNNPEKIFNFLLQEKSNLQGSLFRVYTQLNQRRPLLQFRDEIFEYQYISLYNFQKFESFKNNIKKQKQANQKNQLSAYVDQYFDPKSSHERLREAPQDKILGRMQGHQLATIEEMSDASMDQSRLDERTDYDESQSEISEFPADALMDQMSSFDTDNSMLMKSIRINSDYELDRALSAGESQGVSSIRSSANQEPATEEEKREQEIKSQYVDAISRVFYHLRGALDEPNLITERINVRMLNARSSGEGDPGDVVDGDAFALDLEDLFKNVLEDDRNQPDQSMKLQLDAFLIKRYFSKLDPMMQLRLMGLLKKRLEYVTRMMDLNFEQQNYKFDRVLQFMKKFDTVTHKRISLYEDIYWSLKVNRFICKSWGTTVTLSAAEINQTITQAYSAEDDGMRTLHHQTEILQREDGLGVSRRSAGEDRLRASTSRSLRQSGSALIVNFIEEQHQLDQYNRQQAHSLSKSYDMSVINAGRTTEKITMQRYQQVGASVLASSDSRVTIDINVVSSNLIYVATVLNHEHAKKQILDLDLLQLSTMADDAQDYFLIYDVYKIYLLCVQRVLQEHRQANDKVDPRHADFLGKIQAVFFQQLIQRMWDQLKQDPEMLERDNQIRQHFRRAGAGAAEPIEEDLNQLDLSSSEDESAEEQDSQLYGTAIQTLLTINQTNHLEQKAAIIERSVLTAIRAYKQSNVLLQPSKELSPATLNRILAHIVGECYLRDETFSLHLNLSFVVMILAKAQTGYTSGIQTVTKYLGLICKEIEERNIL